MFNLAALPSSHIVVVDPGDGTEGVESPARQEKFGFGRASSWTGGSASPWIEHPARGGAHQPVSPDSWAYPFPSTRLRAGPRARRWLMTRPG